MKHRSAVFMLIVASLLVPAGCIGSGKVKGTVIRPDPIVENHESLRIVPMRRRFSDDQGVVFLASEQFYFCQRKEFCPIERAFTPVPAPVLVPQPATMKPVVKKLEGPLKAVVHFGAGTAELGKEDKALIDELLLRLDGLDPSGLRVVIAGYTDGSGSPDINVKLAHERAEAVAVYIRERKNAVKEIVAGARPLCCYVASNATADGRAGNRRAEIWIISGGEGNRAKPD